MKSKHRLNKRKRNKGRGDARRCMSIYAWPSSDGTLLKYPRREIVCPYTLPLWVVSVYILLPSPSPAIIGFEKMRLRPFENETVHRPVFLAVFVVCVGPEPDPLLHNGLLESTRSAGVRARSVRRRKVTNSAQITLTPSGSASSSAATNTRFGRTTVVVMLYRKCVNTGINSAEVSRKSDGLLN